MKTKICTTCKAEKPLAAFSKNKSTKDGVCPRCKECHKAYYQANRERLNAKAGEWRNEHPEQYRETQKRLSGRYNYLRRASYVPVAKLTPEQREQRQAKRRVWSKIYYSQNLARMKTYKARHTAIKYGARGIFTTEEFIALCAKYANRCLCCGRDKVLSPDHIIPFAKGGSNSIENIQPLCSSCNSSKRDKIIDYRPDRSCLWPQK